MTKSEQIHALAAQLIAYKTLQELNTGHAKIEKYLQQLAGKIYQNRYINRYDISTPDQCLKAAEEILQRRQTIQPIVNKLKTVKGDRVEAIESLTEEQLDLLLEYYNVSPEEFQNGIFEQLLAGKNVTN